MYPGPDVARLQLLEKEGSQKTSDASPVVMAFAAARLTHRADDFRKAARLAAFEKSDHAPGELDRGEIASLIIVADLLIDREGVSELCECLADSDSAVRLGAMNALRFVGRRAVDCTNALLSSAVSAQTLDGRTAGATAFLSVADCDELLKVPLDQPPWNVLFRGAAAKATLNSCAD